jgi:hypothetical protein
MVCPISGTDDVPLAYDDMTIPLRARATGRAP